MVARIGARFDLERLLKRGNGVATYAGVDRQDGGPVIVKVMETAEVPPYLRLRLEHEASRCWSGSIRGRSAPW